MLYCEKNRCNRSEKNILYVTVCMKRRKGERRKYIVINRNWIVVLVLHIQKQYVIELETGALYSPEGSAPELQLKRRRSLVKDLKAKVSL